MEAAWAAAQRMESFGYADIAIAMKVCLEQATLIVRSWDKAGILEVVREPKGKLRKLWRARDGHRPVMPRRPRSAQDNLWQAARGLKSFQPSDLAIHATTEDIAVGTEEASAYCRFLLAGGYLRTVRKAEPLRKREATYQLIRDTGPRPPVERRVRAIHDPNSGLTVPIGGDA